MDDTLAAQHELEAANGFPRYSPAEMSRRHAALQRLMSDHDLHAVVVGGGTGPLETSVQYFTNWPPLTESFAVFPREAEPYLLVRLFNHLPDARRIATITDIRYGGDTPEKQTRDLGQSLRRLGSAGKRIGVIGPVQWTDMSILQAELPEAEWVDLGGEYRALRLYKSQEELRYTRVAAAMADGSVEAMQQRIHPGMREYELAEIIESAYLGQRGTNLIHFTLSTSMDAPEICVPHQYHPDRVIRAGDVVVTEISALFWGYAGQILRSFTVAAEPSRLYQHLHDVGVRAYDAILDVLRDGVTVGEILDAAEVINEEGFTIWDDLVHGFGGGYLPPIVRTRHTGGATHPDEYRLHQGAVIVVQPNVITTDAKAGVQVGNALLITSDGAEELQRYPTRFLRCA